MTTVALLPVSDAKGERLYQAIASSNKQSDRILTNFSLHVEARSPIVPVIR